jgi:hypothetical protein
MMTITFIYYIVLIFIIRWTYFKYKIKGGENYFQFLINEGENSLKIYIAKTLIMWSLLINIFLFLGLMLYLTIKYFP